MPFALGAASISGLQLSFALQECGISVGRLLLVGDKMPVALFRLSVVPFIVKSTITIDIGVQRFKNHDRDKVFCFFYLFCHIDFILFILFYFSKI